MKDHRTVAFSINWPTGTPLLTIWHHDPKRADSFLRGLPPHDSCGWFNPPSTATERLLVRNAGLYEFNTLFARRAAMQRQVERAHAYYEPIYYEAVRYAWQRIANELSAGWVHLTGAEKDVIYSLASDPVDNLRHVINGVRSAEDCAEFFGLVFNAYRRHHRPRWKHPRWHVWHWRLQFHSWESLRRRLFDRCEGCGKSFKGTSPYSSRWENDKPGWFQSTPGLYHRDCFEQRDRFTHHLRQIKLHRAMRKKQGTP